MALGRPWGVPLPQSWSSRQRPASLSLPRRSSCPWLRIWLLWRDPCAREGHRWDGPPKGRKSWGCRPQNRRPDSFRSGETRPAEKMVKIVSWEFLIRVWRIEKVSIEWSSTLGPTINDVLAIGWMGSGKKPKIFGACLRKNVRVFSFHTRLLGKKPSQILT